MAALKIVRTADGLGVTLPAEMVDRLGLRPDGSLFLVDAGEGRYELRTQDPELDRQIEQGRDFMRRYDETFRALAK